MTVSEETESRHLSSGMALLQQNKKTSAGVSFHIIYHAHASIPPPLIHLFSDRFDLESGKTRKGKNGLFCRQLSKSDSTWHSDVGGVDVFEVQGEYAGESCRF